MGNYNSEYEDYYNSMIKVRTQRTYSDPITVRKKIFSRLLQEILGGVILFLYIISIKFNIVPESSKVYTYSKEIITYNFDYKECLQEIKFSAPKCPEIRKSNIPNRLKEIKWKNISFK